ncbi:MAG: hypothetical protein JXA68_09240, partial [Ignavibacteriales bacterium]|nr:hypothetical protein [Ignavibacteriales bacterium]
MKFLIIYIIVIVVLLVSCYTKLPKIPTYNPNAEYIIENNRIKNFRSSNKLFNEKILGNWVAKEMWPDNGVHEKLLNFDSNNNIHYFPTYNIVGSKLKVFEGIYSAYSDTLIIYFDNRPNIEMYYFEVKENVLLLKVFDEYKNKP